MADADLDKYCKLAMEKGATHAKQIHPSSVVTGAWVRWKCQFGCTRYGLGYCCPPDSPTPEQTRALIDCYHRAILFHLENPASGERMKPVKQFEKMLVELEEEAFKDGYYKAFVLGEGPCALCKECAKQMGAPCNFKRDARPAMEACGIDVFQTARNNGFFISPLKEKTETRNYYCLMLVD
jgi:predicted metal-binding protein